MRHNIRDLAVFEKLTSVSRENKIFEILWHLDLEVTTVKTVITVLLRNVITDEYITDEIAPEYIGYCSVGSFFKGGKKLEERPATGAIRDISINVSDNAFPTNIGSAISDAEYSLDYSYLKKNGRQSSYFIDLCKKQKCMVFKNGTDKVVIPCSVIAATYYLTSRSMRVQLFAQNLHGLYEEIHFDASTETALIILHRNAKSTTAKHIARFAISPHAARCWDYTMNSVRSSPHSMGGATLSAKIPVVQQNLAMRVRCHEASNSEGGTTILVHEIQEEWSNLPFRTLLYGCRSNSASESDAFVMSELDAKSDNKLTNTPPSSIFKGKQIRQFNVPNNPVWEEVEFIQIKFPALDKANARTATEKDNGLVRLSSQRAKGNDPNNRVAGASLDPVPPLPISKQTMAYIEFRNMVSGIAEKVGVTEFFISSDLAVPIKGASNRSTFTLRESYEKSFLHRRHYLYVTFEYGLKSFCLVEFNQTNLSSTISSTQIGTYVLIASSSLGENEARKAADDFVQALTNPEIKNNWVQQDVTFKTKSHPKKQGKDSWESWNLSVLEMVNNKPTK